MQTFSRTSKQLWSSPWLSDPQSDVPVADPSSRLWCWWQKHDWTGLNHLVHYSGGLRSRSFVHLRLFANSRTW